MSNTPKTDKLEQTPLFKNRPKSPECGEALLHARTLERENARLREGIACAGNALTDSICCSGNDADTNLHFVRKLKSLLPSANNSDDTRRSL